MRHQQAAIATDPTPALPRRNRAALEQLLKRYRENKPLAVMLGEGSEVARWLIDAFVARIGDDFDVVRLADPSRDPVGCMSDIVASIGFDTDGLDLADLRQILMMFLAYQRTHRRRTILCVEDAHGANGWTLGTLDRLIEEELAQKFGLLVVLSGDKPLGELIRQPALSALRANCNPKIRVAPFDLDETRDYIHRCIEADGLGPISEVFEFDAITRVFDISAGVPDTINQLIGECLETPGNKPISPGLVEHAAGSLQLALVSSEVFDADLASPSGGQLIARKGDEVVERRAIDTDTLLLGRVSRCDLRLKGQAVSREHAIVLWFESGVRIVDLGSTNGTFVNGERVQNCELESEASIRIGEYDIEFVPPD